jgi:hypothetical protein
LRMDTLIINSLPVRNRSIVKRLGITRTDNYRWYWQRRSQDCLAKIAYLTFISKPI